MKYFLRKAIHEDIPVIWGILQHAIILRKNDGSNQWQDGYPNIAIVEKDIDNEVGLVLVENQTIVAYSAVFINDEPNYVNIQGQWISNSDFVVVHRVAVAKSHLGKGMAKRILLLIEQMAIDKGIFSIRADTNYDNGSMLHIFESLGYVYCGEVAIRDNPRKAYEKILLGQDAI